MAQATDVHEAPPELRGGHARTGAVLLTGAVVLAGAVAALYALTLRRTGGTYVYTLDDPAIHLAVARRLAYDGTWGVVAGHYEAASSSPLWTLILAPTQWVVRGAAGEQVPLVLNLVAAAWVLALLRRDMLALVDTGAGRAARAARAVGLAAVAVLVAVVLFLPGLVMIGMEHTLHMALVLATALAVEARWVRPDGRDGRWARWGPFVLAFLATAARGESTFLAVALAVGLLAAGVRAWHDPAHPPAPTSSRVRAGLGLGLASAAALALFGAINLAYGQSLLPNSVILKSRTDRGDPRRSPLAFYERLTSDRLVVVLLLVAVVVLVAAWRRPPAARDLVPAVFPAAVFAVAVALQAELGGMDRSLRYQAYLYGLGVWLVLRALPSARTFVARAWPAVPAGVLVLLLVPFAARQVHVTIREPHDAEITWEQRYQVARFLGEAYPHDPIAIAELGYISLYHHGPLTDIYGLGDHEVLTAALEGRKNAAFWSEMAHRRGFRVVATYDFTMSADTPRDWIPVADWRSPGAYYKTTRFWATDPGEVEPLIRAIEAYDPRLPPDVEVTINPLARVEAAMRGSGR